jgi:hypothetical protein
VVFFHGLDMNPLFGGHPIPYGFILDELIVRMRNILNRNIFKITFNQNFRDVISNCQNIKREGQNGT